MQHSFSSSASKAPTKRNRKNLCLDALDMIPATVRRPHFNVAALRSGILHLGCGAFHRAHQAVVTQRAIEADSRNGLSWGIASASLRRPDTPDALTPQDGLYTVLERGSQGTKAEVVGSVSEAFFAPADERGLVARLADPATRIVTLTVTAGGYALEPATGRLQPDHPDIQHDLTAERPKSAIGTLVHGLDAVRKAGHQPPVILSCDNLNANGNTLRQAVIDCAALKDDQIASWIERSVQFPNSMVDRIVPGTTEEDRKTAGEALGFEDAAPVSAEPFLQWVIEDFEGERPRWEAGGAQMVTDVAPWETAKLRLLNGTHMVLAYIGGLAGLSTMAEVARDPLLSAMALRFMLDEVVPTLPPGGPDPKAYTQLLLKRWRNPAIRHNVVRIGQNGSEKLAARILRPLRENLRAGRPAPCTILAIAGWIRWFALRDTSGTKVKLVDPIAARLKALCEQVGEDHPRLAEAFLCLEDVFGPKLPRHDEVVRQLGRALSDLHLYDLRSVIAARLN
jgi:fructuronate reductase